MIIKLEYPFSEEYEKGYLQTLKGGRKYVYLYKKGKGKGKRKLISYARYIYSINIGNKIDDDLEVDHINNDRTENLQLLTKKENIKKSVKQSKIIIMICPVCNKSFEFYTRNISTHPNPCCSRTCGGKKKYIINKLNHID